MREAVRERLGLDDPLPVQYGRFLLRVAQGDLGRSIMTRIPVATELRQFFPATIELALAAMIIAVLVGVPLGAVAGYRHNTFVDLGTMLGSLVGVSMPIFWLALMLLWIFGLKLGWFPTTGRIDSEVELQTITNLYVLDSILTGNGQALVSSLHHLALPALALATITYGLHRPYYAVGHAGCVGRGLHTDGTVQRASREGGDCPAFTQECYAAGRDCHRAADGLFAGGCHSHRNDLRLAWYGPLDCQRHRGS